MRTAHTKYGTIESIALHLFSNTNKELLTMDISRHSSTSKERSRKLHNAVSTDKEIKKSAQWNMYAEEYLSKCKEQICDKDYFFKQLGA